MLRIFALVVLFSWIPAAGAKDRLIMVLGDSLSASYGMDALQGWVALLEARLAEQGYRYRVVNASISGDTSRGALVRLDALLHADPPQITILALGGNDGLRGIALHELKENLDQIAAKLLESGSRVLVIPMKLPPNYGPAYTEDFERVYRDLEDARPVAMGKFLLDGIALRPELMQEDGIHPRVEAQPLMLENVWRSLQPLL